MIGDQSLARADRASPRSRLAIVGVVLWGLLLAAWLTRVYFLYPPERCHESHESYTYVARLLEFREQLSQGRLSPQWCGNYYGGLGSPQWSYYQPGLFYIASLAPPSVPATRALGMALGAFTLLGYLAMYGLVAERFGRAAGWLSASAFLLGPYACSNLYIRGDLSEFAAMMILPSILLGLTAWFDHGRPGAAVIIAIAEAGLIVTHPCIGLLGTGMAVFTVAYYGWKTRQVYRTMAAAIALVIGFGMAAFYWFPVFFELDLVQAGRAIANDEGIPYYSREFIRPITKLAQRFDPACGRWLTLDLLLPGLFAASCIAFFQTRNHLSGPQRRLAGMALLGALLFTFLIMRESIFLWHLLRPLQKVQFPWRTMTVLSALVSIAAGAIPLWRRNRLGVMCAAAVVLLLVAFSQQYTQYRLSRWPSPQSTADVAAIDFKPDSRNEWMPSRASPDVPADYRVVPVAGQGAEVKDFVRTQGRLACRVRTSAAANVVLPHYYFPVGWQATLAGKAIPLGFGRFGLMEISLPAGADGNLEIQFYPTPMRIAGLWTSAATLVAAFALFGVLYSMAAVRSATGASRGKLLVGEFR